MKVLIIIPDGVAIRNFLCTPFIDHVREEAEVVIWHALPACSLAAHRQRLGEAVRWAPLPRFREGLAERVLRQAKIFAQLYWHRDDPTMGTVLAGLRPSGRLLSRVLRITGRALGRACGSHAGIVRLDALHARLVRRAPYLGSFLHFLETERPDAVFCAHQRAGRAVPAMVAAARLGLPTATFIYSWDNLPKGRMAVHAEHYLLWSEHMRDEMGRFYPEVEEARLHVVGTPQFEPYGNPSLVQTREAFLKSLGLEPARPVVCFSGDDTATSPHDPAYLGDLAAALRSLPAADRPQLLFRPVPVENIDRFRPVLEDYPEIAVSQPRWLVAEGDWTQRVATAEDIALLVNVVHHCDAVFNVGSTMAMDFAILGKPGIFFNYNQPQIDPRYDIQDIYRLPHFRTVHALQPVYWAEAAAELAALTTHVLAHPDEKAAARRAWLQCHALHPLDQASRRCGRALLEIAGA